LLEKKSVTMGKSGGGSDLSQLTEKQVDLNLRTPNSISQTANAYSSLTEVN
jgi:hypothetical protein